MDVFKELFRIFSKIGNIFNKIKLEDVEVQDQPSSKSYALILGINKYDKSFYGNIDDLRGCVVDSKKYKTFLEDKIKVTDLTTLIDNNATKEAFRYYMNKFKSLMEPGDTLYLFSSRHGTKIKDLNGDEKSGYDQAMCLHDGLILDDELSHFKETLPDNCNFIIFSDACENGTISKQALGKSTSKVKTVHVNRENFIKERKDFVNTLTSKTLKELKPGKNISVLALSGADDWNFSYDFGEDGGNFTNEWFKSLERLEYDCTWYEAFKDVKMNIQLQIPFMDDRFDINKRISNKKIL